MAGGYIVRAGGGPEAGPMGADAVRAMVRSGELKAEDLIRKDGTAKWLTIASVPQLAADLPKPPAPPPDELGLHEVVAPRAVPTSVGSAPLPAARNEDGKRLQPVEVPMMVLLSVVTLGIWGIIWFHQVMKQYRAISGRNDKSAANTETYFWVYVGCLGLAMLTLYFIVGVLPLIGAAVCGFLLLKDVLTDRGRIAQAVGATGLTSDGLQLGFWIAGCVLSICGLPFAIAQAVMFFNDHNKLCAACAIARPDWVESGD